MNVVNKTILQDNELTLISEVDGERYHNEEDKYIELSFSKGNHMHSNGATIKIHNKKSLWFKEILLDSESLNLLRAFLNKK